VTVLPFKSKEKDEEAKKIVAIIIEKI